MAAFGAAGLAGSGGFNFGGLPSTVAATTAASTGISFGQIPPSLMGYTGASDPKNPAPMSAVGFGTPLVSSTPAVSSQIGVAPLTTNTLGGLGFGTSPVAGFNFGSVGQQSSGITGPPQTGFGFGAPASAAVATTANTLASLLSAPATTVAAIGPSTPLGFGVTPGTASSTGFSLGNVAPTAATTGFSGIQETPAMPTGFSLGQGGTQTTSTGFPLGLGGTKMPATTTTGLLSLGLGGTPSAATSTGLSLGLGGKTSTAASTGLGLGGMTSTAASTGLGLGGMTSTAASTGLGLGGTTSAMTSTGLPLGLGVMTPTATSTGLSLGIGGTTSAVTATGLSLGLGGMPSLASSVPGFASKSTGLGLGFGGITTTTASSLSSGIGLGGSAVTASVAPFGIAKSTAGSNILFGGAGTLATTTAAGCIFSTQATKPATTGLGGVDPKTSTTLAGGSLTDAKTSDGKTVKEVLMPQEVTGTVQTFQNYVKEEKVVREGIARMSYKPLYKVQDDIVALKQLLSVVSNGLQRNVCAVEKLKIEMRQELKNAEMSQRTQDIPPGLQYENTAPTEYFQRLVETFESQMQSYRQQIEMLESHLASTHQSSKLTPEDLIILLKKLHETFIALAANLHQIHEAVKTQKEHYLNYRKIFHSDSKNIFEKHRKTLNNQVTTRPTDLLGPSPFSGISSAATAAMAAALNRSQQPVGAPPIAGLGTTTLGQPGGLFGPTASTTTPAFSGFGTTASVPTQSNLFGAGFGKTTSQPLFGAPLGGLSSNTATVRPLGFGATIATGSVFGNASQPTVGFGAASQTQGSTGFGFGVPGAATAQATTAGNLNMSATTEQPFTLGKPPWKRGKR